MGEYERYEWTRTKTGTKKRESMTVEFKSWIKSKGFKERINLITPELVALANTKGGIILLGIENSGEVTGCMNFNI